MQILLILVNKFQCNNKPIKLLLMGTIPTMSSVTTSSKFVYLVIFENISSKVSGWLFNSVSKGPSLFDSPILKLEIIILSHHIWWPDKCSHGTFLHKTWLIPLETSSTETNYLLLCSPFYLLHSKQKNIWVSSMKEWILFGFKGASNEDSWED